MLAKSEISNVHSNSHCCSFDMLQNAYQKRLTHSKRRARRGSPSEWIEMLKMRLLEMLGVTGENDRRPRSRTITCIVVHQCHFQSARLSFSHFLTSCGLLSSSFHEFCELPQQPSMKALVPHCFAQKYTVTRFQSRGPASSALHRTCAGSRS